MNHSSPGLYLSISKVYQAKRKSGLIFFLFSSFTNQH